MFYTKAGLPGDEAAQVEASWDGQALQQRVHPDERSLKTYARHGRFFKKYRIEQHPVNISCVAYLFGIKPKTLHYWYKENLSGYKQDLAARLWGEKKITIADEDTGEVVKEKPVPIAKAENFGSHMTIDEKQIAKKMYTIMSNAKTGKIALLAQTNETRRTQTSYRKLFFRESERSKIGQL